MQCSLFHFSKNKVKVLHFIDMRIMNLFTVSLFVLLLSSLFACVPFSALHISIPESLQQPHCLFCKANFSVRRMYCTLVQFFQQQSTNYCLLCLIDCFPFSTQVTLRNTTASTDLTTAGMKPFTWLGFLIHTV